MKNTPDRMIFLLEPGQGSKFCCLFCLCANLFFSSPAIAQRYYSFTLATAGATQFFSGGDGVLSVEFPFTVKDASGVTTAATFTGRKKDIYASPKYYICPFAFEMGWLRNVVHVGAYFSLVKGAFGPGFHGSIGYGRILQAGRYAIKCSMDLTTTIDSRDGQYDLLGKIDNKNKTLYLPGQTLGPTFTIPGGRYSPPETYASNTVDISYSQNETSLLPRISILPDPFRHHGLFELSVGYNLPLHEQGLLNFIQEAKNRNNISGKENFVNSSISSSYNGKPVTSAPYRFRGLYLELLFELIAHKR